MEAVKPFRETKVGSWLKDKLPDALETVGDVLPERGVLGIVKNIVSRSSIPPEQKLEFEKILYDLEKELASIEVEDRANARSLQIEALRAADPLARRFIYYFSIFWSCFSALYLAGITFFYVPAENIRVVDTVLGFMLGTAITMMFSYFYGGSMRDIIKGNQKQQGK